MKPLYCMGPCVQDLFADFVVGPHARGRIIGVESSRGKVVLKFAILHVTIQVSAVGAAVVLVVHAAVVLQVNVLPLVVNAVGTADKPFVGAGEVHCLGRGDMAADGATEGRSRAPGDVWHAEVGGTCALDAVGQVNVDGLGGGAEEDLGIAHIGVDAGVPVVLVAPGGGDALVRIVDDSVFLNSPVALERQDVVIVHVVLHDAEGNLLGIGCAGGRAGLFAGLAQGWQQHCGQDGDDGDDHQKFNEGELKKLFHLFFLFVCVAFPEKSFLYYFRLSTCITEAIAKLPAAFTAQRHVFIATLRS